MRRIVIIFILAAVCAVSRAEGYLTGEIPNVQVADRSRFTSNPDGILGAAAVAQIDSMCCDLRDRGVAEVAVVAVREIEGVPPLLGVGCRRKKRQRRRNLARRGAA